MMRYSEFCAILAALTLASAPLAAQQASQAVDQSFTAPGGDRILQVWIDVPASPQSVWERWTTQEGWTSFATPHAILDFRVGGVIETSYAETFTPGDAANIKNEILAYVPERLLVIRAVQAPPGFPHPELFFQTACVIEVVPQGDGSRVTVTGMGFRPGPEFDELYAMFRSGNAFTLEQLRRSFVEGPIVWPAARADAPAAVEEQTQPDAGQSAPGGGSGN